MRGAADFLLLNKLARNSDMTKHDYDESWEKWNDMIRYSPAPRHRRRIALNLLKSFAPDCRSIHDIGCGNGLFLEQLHRQFPQASLHGSDISSLVTARNARHFPEMTFSALDLCEEQNLDPDFDAVICMEVLEHLPDLPTALKNISSMLRTSGILILSVPSGPVRPIDKMMGHVQHFSDARVFAQHGLALLHQRRWGFPFFNLYKTAINIRPEKMNSMFAEQSYSPWQKSAAALVYLLFFLNINCGGEQLFAVLRKTAA